MKDVHVVFLRLDVQEVVDTDMDIIAPDSGVMDGDHDVFLFVGILVQQHLQPVAKVVLVVARRRNNCDNSSYQQSPVQESEQVAQHYRQLEQYDDREEIACADEKVQGYDGQHMMPDPPGLRPAHHRIQDDVYEKQGADECHQSEEKGEQKLVPLEFADAERLEEIQDEHDYCRIYQAFLYSRAVVFYRIRIFAS